MFLIFVFMLISRQIQKSKSGLRWIEVDLNPPQPTSTHLNPLSGVGLGIGLGVGLGGQTGGVGLGVGLGGQTGGVGLGIGLGGLDWGSD